METRALLKIYAAKGHMYWMEGYETYVGYRTLVRSGFHVLRDVDPQINMCL